MSYAPSYDFKLVPNRLSSWKTLFCLTWLGIALVFALLPRGSQNITNDIKTSYRAKSSLQQPLQQEPKVQTKDEITKLIIKEMTLAGYKAPLFAVSVAKCESGLRPTAVGDSGKSYGVWQIHLPSHPDITKEQALDPEWATKWAANMFAKGYAHRWTCARILS